MNLAKKHRRQTRQDQQGGIVQIEVPLAIANLMVFCKNCDKPARVGFQVTKDKEKNRICKNCNGVL
jgi:large subunit ribosomal protein L24